MSIKEKIKFCGTTPIPEGSRVEIKGFALALTGLRGIAKPPYGFFAGQRGWISIDLDKKHPTLNLHRVNIKASEVEIIK